MADDYFSDRKEIVETWDEWLTAFVKEIYPAFKKHGFTVPEAVALYRMNLLYNRLLPPDEPWRG